MITYSTNKEKRLADKRGSVCPSCRSYLRVISVKVRRHLAEVHRGKPGTPWSEERRKRMEELNPERKRKLSEKMRGRGNPMYGRSLGPWPHNGTPHPLKGKPSPLRGRPKSAETRAKLSASCIGRKPNQGISPSISGVYQGLHFRSSCELRFLVENGGSSWQSGEDNEFRIPYKDASGKKRYYFPDWFRDGVLVEIKPPNWKDHPRNKETPAKNQAAEIYCGTKGWTFRLMEVPAMPKYMVFEMRDRGEITLEPRWEKQYQEWRSKRA